MLDIPMTLPLNPALISPSLEQYPKYRLKEGTVLYGLLLRNSPLTNDFNEDTDPEQPYIDDRVRGYIVDRGLLYKYIVGPGIYENHYSTYLHVRYTLLESVVVRDCRPQTYPCFPSDVDGIIYYDGDYDSIVPIIELRIYSSSDKIQLQILPDYSLEEHISVQSMPSYHIDIDNHLINSRLEQIE